MRRVKSGFTALDTYTLDDQPAGYFGSLGNVVSASKKGSRMRLKYICEICDSEYDEELHARACESSSEPPKPTNVEIGKEYYDRKQVNRGFGRKGRAERFVLRPNIENFFTIRGKTDGIGHNWCVDFDAPLLDFDSYAECNQRNYTSSADSLISAEEVDKK